MADLTDDQLDRIEAHSRGGLPPGDGEHYVEVLVAEVRRLRGEVSRLRDGIRLIADHAERDEPPERTAEFARALLDDQEDDRG